MNYGTGKLKLRLMNADGSQNMSRVFPYSNKLEPAFQPDLIREKTIDKNLTIFCRGWDVEIDIYWPSLSDEEYEDLVKMMRDQFDWNSGLSKTKYIELTPRDDNTSEKYEGWITTDIKVLNEYHFITHGARIKFEGKKLLSKTEFLL